MPTTDAKHFTFAVLLALCACTQESPGVCRNEPPGFLVRNVQIVDGSGAPAVAGSVRVNDGLIANLGDLEPCEGETVIDGGGQFLAPGFIDTHSHADKDIFEHPEALPVVSQGITTIVVGQDGRSPYPLNDFFSKLETAPAAVNIASYVGHNTLRHRGLGNAYQRAASDDEIDSMKAMLASELESGALGLSTGLEYDPGIYSDTSEVLALARVAADAGGRYISHIRSEDRWLEEAIEEIILIGRETGMPVQISHLKLAMKRLWGSAPRIIERLDAARAEGIDITADIYPYEYWQSTIMVLLPDRDPSDREAIAEVLDQLAPPEGIWLTRYPSNPEYVGKTLTEIAAILEVDAITAFSQIAAESERARLETGDRSAATIIGTSMQAADIRELIAWPEANICTDGGIVSLHPRSAGSFPRVLSRYVRDQNVLTLEEAVRKMTSLAAEHMGFTDRGRIRQGAVADLVLFDPDTVIDHATPLAPTLLSEGITTVWVGGEIVFSGGAVTNKRPGRVIRRLM
ncbi:MAG: D-aminoacylase [Woeseiaceae bacterium]|nr:D-aminoacylase [Woeseiaceae bacterium]